MNYYWHFYCTNPLSMLNDRSFQKGSLYNINLLMYCINVKDVILLILSDFWK